MKHFIVNVKRNGIGNIVVRATTEEDPYVDFYGSSYGGPVFMDFGLGKVRVDDPERFGVFADSPRLWVDEFYDSCDEEENE